LKLSSLPPMHHLRLKLINIFLFFSYFIKKSVGKKVGKKSSVWGEKENGGGGGD